MTKQQQKALAALVDQPIGSIHRLTDLYPDSRTMRRCLRQLAWAEIGVMPLDKLGDTIQVTGDIKAIIEQHSEKTRRSEIAKSP